jgi:hypothetical protein
MLDSMVSATVDSIRARGAGAGMSGLGEGGDHFAIV